MVDFGIIARILGVFLVVIGVLAIILGVFNSFNMFAIIGGAAVLAIGLVMVTVFAE